MLCMANMVWNSRILLLFKILRKNAYILEKSQVFYKTT